jgi:hypothetical protein
MDFGCPYRIGDCSSLYCDGLAVGPSRSPDSSDLPSSERRYPRVYYSAATWTSNYACIRLASDFTPDEMTERAPAHPDGQQEFGKKLFVILRS